MVVKKDCPRLNEGRKRTTLLAKRNSDVLFLKYELDCDKFCENDGFTAASRVYEYTDEQITPIIESRCVSEAVSRQEFAS